jgi:hypothetical protein
MMVVAMGYAKPSFFLKNVVVRAHQATNWGQFMGQEKANHRYINKLARSWVKALMPEKISTVNESFA